MEGMTWCPTDDELRYYLGAACGELAQAVCELRPDWIEVVRYPDHEENQSEWEGLPWGRVLPSHHVAARAPNGRALDIRGFRDDPGWTTAKEYTTRFEITEADRDVARRLLSAAGDQDPRAATERANPQG